MNPDKTNLACIEDLLKAYPKIQSDLALSMENAEAILRAILTYVEDHKWLINEKIPFTVTLEQALFSWYENVYITQWEAMNEAKIWWGFPKRPVYEVFDLVSKNYYLHRKGRWPRFTYLDASNVVLALFSERTIPRLWGKFLSRGKL